MATPKRRKLDGGTRTELPALSAVSARQKLWGTSAFGAYAKPEVQGGQNESKGPPLAGRIPTRSPSQTPPTQTAERESVEKQLATNSEASVEGLGVPAPASPAVRSAVQLSTFRPNKGNYQLKKDGRVLLRAAEGERLVIIGSYGINVQEGEVTISGAALSLASNATHWVHAPHCHALPVLRISSRAVLELRPHPAARSFRQLATLSPMFGKLWPEPQVQPKPSAPTFQVICTSEDVPKRASLQELVSPAEWNKKLAGLVAANLKGNTPVVFLCGPKSSGKSTFGRLLGNRLITDTGGASKRSWRSVAVLDIDPGQPEFGPPGVISLNKLSLPNLAPSFCHPALEPVRGQLKAHAVAAITPAQDPTHYIECALDLVAHKQATLGSKCPLIVNTPGWIQGTGLEVLAELVKKIRPTEVIYMSQDGPEETVDSLTAACGTAIPFVTLPSQTTSNTSRSSLDFRTMQSLSYFHLQWSSLATDYTLWDPTPLTALCPWRVRYRGSERGFVGILCYDHQPGASLLAEAINGMILALVQIESHAAFRDLLSPEKSSSSSMKIDLDNDDGNDDRNSRIITTSEETTIPKTPEGIPLIQNPRGKTLDPRHSKCLGLVLIRGIDTGRGELQVLTPIPEDLLFEAEATSGNNNANPAKKKKNNLVLVAGKFDTPTWAYAEDSYLQAAAKAGTKKSPTQGGGSQLTQGEEGGNEDMDVDEGESESESEMEEHDEGDIPWVERLHGSQRKAVGSMVWRVRRDLGRNN